MTTYAARHVVLEGDDLEPEVLAAAGGDVPAPRRALMPEDAMTSYLMYQHEPELKPFDSVVQGDQSFRRPSASEFGEAVVAALPSKTMPWHLASSSTAPLDPGPLGATPPINGPAVDPASVPTPVSQYAAFAYQSMPSPSPYTSVLTPAPYASGPAQGSLSAPLATPYENPTPGPYEMAAPGPLTQASQVFGGVNPVGMDIMALANTPLVKAAVTVQRVFALVFILVIVGVFTVTGLRIGGSSTWFIVGFAWFVGIMMIIGTLRPGRARLGRRA